jgi:hypothetical protein
MFVGVTRNRNFFIDKKNNIMFLKEQWTDIFS